MLPPDYSRILLLAPDFSQRDRSEGRAGARLSRPMYAKANMSLQGEGLRWHGHSTARPSQRQVQSVFLISLEIRFRSRLSIIPRVSTQSLTVASDSCSC